jgi:hypothetical protein
VPRPTPATGDVAPFVVSASSTAASAPTVAVIGDSVARDYAVTLVDMAPLVCPAGPPCGAVNGVDFRPDTTHFDDAGGMRAATYLTARVPALLRLIGRR